MKIPETVTCHDGRAMNDLRDSDMCPNILTIIQTIGSILLFIFTTARIIYYKNKTKILIYCYSSQWRVLRWFVSHPDDIDIDKRYDAFISFANEDFKFVAETLVPQLEENCEIKYKLCLHYRQWIGGELILTQINNSIKKSRRTIIIMSPHFLQSVWGQAEFRMAYTEGIKEGRLRVIVIMYKDIGGADGLHEDLKDYLSTTTYLEWEDTPTFWKKLYFALPHPPEDEEGVKCKVCSFCVNRRTSINDEIVPPYTMELQTYNMQSEQYFSFDPHAF